MAFMLRVRCTCPNAEVMSTNLDALGTMAKIQVGPPGPHKGVITYHFSRPDPPERPLYVEFTEVYANEESFWAHSLHQEFMEAYMKGFSQEIVKKSEMVTYGYNVPGGKVKETCDNFLKCRYPATYSGFVLNPEKWSLDVSEGDGPVMLLFRVCAKSTRAEEIVRLFSTLSGISNPGVTTSIVAVPEPEAQPDQVEFIEICSSNEKLQLHLTMDTSKAAISDILQNSDSVSVEAYGTVTPKSEELLRCSGLSYNVRSTDVGYVLHPEVDRESKV